LKAVKKPKAAAATPPARPAPKVAFPKKALPPTHAEFAARLPAPVGKRFEAVRAYLKKQEIAEDFYYYGPRTGWAYRYLEGESSLCSIMILKGRLVGIIALDAAAQAKVPWAGLSDVAKRARKVAHGTPSLLWLDIPLDGTGAMDFKSLLKAKISG
jgi:hypothetical protein